MFLQRETSLLITDETKPAVAAVDLINSLNDNHWGRITWSFNMSPVVCNGRWNYTGSAKEKLVRIKSSEKNFKKSMY